MRTSWTRAHGTRLIDLGTQRTVTEIDSNWFQVLPDDVFLPPEVRYSVSTDGVNYHLVYVIHKPAISADLQSKTYRAINLVATGRYVKIEVDGGTAWTKTNEAEVRGP
ncbi:hypothetical protein [Streptacidiphilus albus]|uniref:hypothetical protein n=1 Tax=Streptacidiphilus albus TaxID=105425 RepID=UPI00054B6585|nr:hypothetical protein [Streptacidiphilus albus]